MEQEDDEEADAAAAGFAAGGGEGEQGQGQQVTVELTEEEDAAVQNVGLCVFCCLVGCWGLGLKYCGRWCCCCCCCIRFCLC